MRLVETDVSQTSSSEDSKSLNVEQTHDRTGRPVANTAASPRPPPKISFKDNWMQELGSVVAGHGENTNPNERRASTEEPASSNAQEIDERFLLGCESTNERTGRPVYNCMPVSVERSDKDKDEDENVDADQVRTGEPLEWTIQQVRSLSWRK